VIYNFNYSNSSNRQNVLDYLKENKFKRVLDIGFSGGNWSSEYVTHYVDFFNSPSTSKIGFIGNICLYSTWEPILQDVNVNGKFDFVICSHTLEDISAPQFVSEMLCKVSNEGFIAVPSKNKELQRTNKGPQYGYMHHRWIFNKEDLDFVAYPKLSFLEHQDFTKVIEKFNDTTNELQFFWKEDFSLKLANNDFMGPEWYDIPNIFKGLEKN